MTDSELRSRSWGQRQGSGTWLMVGNINRQYPGDPLQLSAERWSGG